MPSELLKRILPRLDLLYPPFLSRFLDVLAACQKRGANYYASLGYRTFPEQAALYFQGRTTPGKIVTNARAGYSLHNYGLAVDVIRDADLTAVGLQPRWDKAGYDILKEEAERVGLQAGVPGLGDEGHVQVAVNRVLGPGQEKKLLETMRGIYQASPAGDELQAVWDHLGGLDLGLA